MSSPMSTKHYKKMFLHHLEKDEDHTSFVKFVCDQESDIDRINFVYEKLEKYGIIEKAFLEDRKVNDGLKEIHEKNANVCLQSGQYEKSVLYWTTMLAFTKNEKSLAMGYAKRSEALFKLELYEECITDIKRAFRYGYPHHLRPHLIRRRNKSKDLLKTKTKIKPYENPPTIPDHQKNELSEYASNAVEIRSGKTGKYIVAARDIQIGEVIGVEPPIFASVAQTGYLYHCHHCFKLCYNLIPCDSCTKTLFCSETCKGNAFADYHKDECPIMNSLIQLIATEWGTLVPWRILFSSPTEEESSVIESITNTSFRNLDGVIFDVVLTGAIMYGLVKNHTGRFQGPNSEKDEADFKSLITKFIPFCISQTITVRETVCSRKTLDCGYDTLDQVFAQGLYPLTKTFRHSCFPNVHYCNHGLTSVLTAVRTIKKGEECFISYWTDFGFLGVEERKQHLYKSYGFECKCPPCEENWPQFALLSVSRYTDFAKQHESEFASYSVDSIKRSVKKTIKKARRLETTEACPEFFFEMVKLKCQMSSLGNKRPVF